MTLDVSPDQLGAIMSGAKGRSSPDYDIIEVPEGPRKLPHWLLDLHVNWNDAHSNRPKVTLKCAGDVGTWDKRWYRRGQKTWITESGDGRAYCHYHSGPVAWRPKKKFLGYEKIDGKPNFRKPIEEEYQLLCTTEQDGYGGRHFTVHMAEDSDIFPGEEVSLIGPWHGGAPPGYVDVAYASWPSDYGPYRKGDPWWKHMGYFGLYIKTELFIDALATFHPHAPIALVDLGYARYIEPCDPRTMKPKGFLDPEDCPGHIPQNPQYPEGHNYFRCALCHHHRFMGFDK